MHIQVEGMNSWSRVERMDGLEWSASDCGGPFLSFCLPS